jgi:hypothetical protein
LRIGGFEQLDTKRREERTLFKISSTGPAATRLPASMIPTVLQNVAQLREDVRGDDDRLPHARQLFQELAQLDPGARVEAEAGPRRRCKHLRVVEESFREASSLLMPRENVLT